MDEIKIFMIKTIRPSLLKPGAVLKNGRSYDAVADKNGVVSGICKDGTQITLKPTDFYFITGPQWVIDMNNHAKVSDVCWNGKGKKPVICFGCHNWETGIPVGHCRESHMPTSDRMVFVDASDSCPMVASLAVS